jgi:hypothetical protein
MPKAPKQANAVFHFMFRWSVDHDKPTQIELYDHLRSHPNIDKFIFQAEDTGDNPHYQGYFHGRTKIRPKTYGRSWNEDFEGIEIRACSTKGIEALKNYCMKTDTRVDGPWADKAIYMGADLWPMDKCPKWQQQLHALLAKPPDDRHMYWIYDPVGNNGKTKFVKTVAFRHGALALAYGHSTDVLNLVSKFPGKSCYIWNLTRAKPATLSALDLYSAMESVKDGLFTNLKYETAQVLMNSPHVVVMANHLPEFSQISLDRWVIYSIHKGANNVRLRQIDIHGNRVPTVPNAL